MSMDLRHDSRPEILLREILKRLPVKSLVRFTSVSKAWSHRIRDPNFITSHLQFNKTSSSSSSSVLGLNFRRYPQFEYFRIDHTHKTTLERLETPFLWDQIKPDPKPQWRFLGSRVSIRGHGNGLVLVFDSVTFLVDKFNPEFRTKKPRYRPKIALHVDKYIIFNPVARRFQILPDSTIEPPSLNFVHDPDYEYRKFSAVGLGFVDDLVYKVVRVTYGVAEVMNHDSMNDYKAYEPPWVEAYDSRSCSWRRVPMNPEFSYEYLNDGVFNSSDGCLYWLGRGYGDRDKYSILVWFHLVDETWGETLLPYKSLYDHDDLEEGAFDGYGICQFVQVLGGSVVLLVADRRNRMLSNVWKMNREEDKVSWTHMCRLNFVGSPLGFIREGELLLMMNAYRKEEPGRVFMKDGEFYQRELCPTEDDGKFVLHDLKKRNNACYGLTDLDFRVGNAVPDFVESLVLFDGESGFIEEVAEETYYFPKEDVPEETYIEEEEEEEEDFGDFSSLFDDNFPTEEEDFGDLSSMFDDNFELILY